MTFVTTLGGKGTSHDGAVPSKRYQAQQKEAAPGEGNTEPSTLDSEQHQSLSSRASDEPIGSLSSSSSLHSFLSVPECSISNISDEDQDISSLFKRKTSSCN